MSAKKRRKIYGVREESRRTSADTAVCGGILSGIHTSDSLAHGAVGTEWPRAHWQVISRR